MNYYYNSLKREITKEGVQIAHNEPTENTQGAWNEKEQHMAPATGVICAELEKFQPREDMQIARISLDILGMIHLENFKITTQIIRPGRTIELIESKMEVKGRVCISARTWRLSAQNTEEVAGLEDEKLKFYKDLKAWDGLTIWKGGYIKSIAEKSRKIVFQPGKGQVWLTNDLEMIEGEETSSFVKLMGMVDTMNGVAVRQKNPFKYMFPNVDLQIHLYRLPKGKRLGLDVQQQYGENGVGLTSAILHDENGSFGHAEQILTVRKMP